MPRVEDTQPIMVLKNKRQPKTLRGTVEGLALSHRDYGFLPLFFYVSDLSKVSSMSITFILGDKSHNLK